MKAVKAGLSKSMISIRPMIERISILMRSENVPATYSDTMASVSSVDYAKIITIKPAKRGGKRCIRGLRITVQDILEYLASGMTEEELLQDFSELTDDDLKACLAFAADLERKLSTASACDFI